MAVAYATKTETGTGDVLASSLAGTKPTGTVSGDLLIAVLGVKRAGVTSHDGSSGWTKLEEAVPFEVAGNVGASLYYKIAGGSEPASYTFAWSGATAEATLTIARYTGAHATTPINESDKAVALVSTSGVAPSVTTTENGCLIGRYLVQDRDDSTVITSPATERWNWGEGGSNNTSQAGSDAPQVSAGATGTATFTLSIARDNAAFTVAIAPAAGGSTFTATSGLTASSATLVVSASHTAPTYEGTSAVSAPSATLAASATHTAPTYEGAADLTASAATLSASAVFATAVYSATASLTTSSATLAASATFDAPVYTAAADLTVASAQITAVATFDGPEFTATAGLTASSATLAGSATFTEAEADPTIVFDLHGLDLSDGAVTEWADRSDADNDASQGSSLIRPVAMNGVVKFGGLSGTDQDHMDFVGLDLSAQTDGTIECLFRIRGAQTTWYAGAPYNVGTFGNLSHFGSEDPAVAGAVQDDFGSSARPLVSPNGTIEFGVWYAIIHEHDGTAHTQQVQLDGVDFDAVDSATDWPNGGVGQVVNIGAHQGAALAWLDVRSCRLYSRLLTPAEKATRLAAMQADLATIFDSGELHLLHRDGGVVTFHYGTIYGGTATFSHQLQRSTTGTGSWSSVGTAGSGTECELTDPSASTTSYYYRVVTTDAEAETATSQTFGPVATWATGQAAAVQTEFNLFIHFAIWSFQTAAEYTADPIGFDSWDKFQPDASAPAQWARIAKLAGCTRLILYAMHHEGQRLWPSANSDHNLSQGTWYQADPDNRDFVQLVKDAADAEGLEFGIAYSIWNRHHEDTAADPTGTYQALNEADLTELCAYEPVVIYLDKNGDPAAADYAAFYTLMKGLLPSCEVLQVQNTSVVSGQTDRACHEEPNAIATAKLGRPTAANAVAADYLSTLYLARDVPGNGMWAQRTDETPIYKPASMLAYNRDEIPKRAASYTLSVAPDETGRIRDGDVQRLLGIAGIAYARSRHTVYGADTRRLTIQGAPTERLTLTGRP